MPLSDATSTNSLFIILFILLIMSACFSATETALMSVNRYRIKHKAKTEKRAQRILSLLARPDRLLAVILIGNNFVNIAASSIATLIGLRLIGEMGVVVSTITLTLVILIFSEITPKTLAALKSERISYIAAPMLHFLLIVMFPLVSATNALSNGLLSLFGVSPNKKNDVLTSDELKTVVNETNTLIPTRHQEMLTSILDLEHSTVDDIMIPRTEITGIDLSLDTETILKQLKNSQHTLIPLYRNDINQIEGIIHLKDIAKLLISGFMNKKQLLQYAQKPYFIPEGTPLHTQLFQFQRNKIRLALIVDEYGDMQGLVTLEDILEEIVGEFTTDDVTVTQALIPQPDGSFIVDGGFTIRELNRRMGWQLPIQGAKTLNGVILEYLELIPTTATCVLLNRYPIEVLQVQDNMIKTCKIYPQLPEKKSGT